MSGSVSPTTSRPFVPTDIDSADQIPQELIAIQVERSNVLDDQIKDQMADMKKRNDWLKSANSALAQLRTAMPTSTSSNGTWGSFTASDGSSHTVLQWCNDNGVSISKDTDDLGSQSEFQAAIDNMKSTIDTVNSQSQMDMVRLQGLMDKRNQAFDMITNTQSKNTKQLDSDIGNLR